VQSGLYSVDINNMALELLEQLTEIAETHTERFASCDTSLPMIEQLETVMLDMPQIDVPVVHHFGPDVYMREAIMPEGSFIIGHEHTTEHYNIVLTGRASVLVDGVIHEMKAPCIIKSKANVRKIGYIHETMRWLTIHPTKLTDIKELEDTLIVKSESFKNHEMLKELENFQKQLIQLKEQS